MSSSPQYLSTFQTSAVTILDSDTTAKKTLVTAGAAGCRLDSISVVSSDIAAVTLQLWATISGTDYLLAEVTIPTLSGIGGVLPVELIDAAKLPAVANLNLSGSLFLKAGTIIKVSAKATVTAAKTVTVTAFYVDA